LKAKKTVNLTCKDGSSMILKNVLFVPKLGANLLSARHLYEAGLVGCFDSGNMYFKLNRKTVVQATIENGLYIVDHISSHYKETVFPCIDQNMNDSNEQEITIPSSSNQMGKLNQSAKDRYLLFHRFFVHLGLKKISKLHTVITFDRLIKIPKDLEISQICAIT
jgi:hypothetical protein